jgi:hypothetical protein
VAIDRGVRVLLMAVERYGWDAWRPNVWTMSRERQPTFN